MLMLIKNRNKTTKNAHFFITIGFYLLMSICKNTNPHKGQPLWEQICLLNESTHDPLLAKPKLSGYQAFDIP